jgi:hypothetical protein
MGNGALPNGPSYRAHPRLYHFGHAAMTSLSPLSGARRTIYTSRCTSTATTAATASSKAARKPEAEVAGFLFRYVGRGSIRERPTTLPCDWLSHPAKAGHPVRCGFAIYCQRLWNTGSPAFAGYDNLWCGGAARFTWFNSPADPCSPNRDRAGAGVKSSPTDCAAAPR